MLPLCIKLKTSNAEKSRIQRGSFKQTIWKWVNYYNISSYRYIYTCIENIC